MQISSVERNLGEILGNVTLCILVSKPYSLRLSWYRARGFLLNPLPALTFIADTTKAVCGTDSPEQTVNGLTVSE